MLQTTTVFCFDSLCETSFPTNSGTTATFTVEPFFSGSAAAAGAGGAAGGAGGAGSMELHAGVGGAAGGTPGERSSIAAPG